jgi:hypothetical protein
MATQDQPNDKILPEDINNPNNPFYLHPTDNPNTVVITPLLEGASNYHIWSRHMADGLICKDKYGFVDGTILQPKINDPLYGPWRKCNTMVIQWITKSVSTQIGQSIAYFDNATDIWHDLRTRFSKGDYFRHSDLLQSVHSLKQGDLDLSSYFTQLQILWQELEILRPVYTCICAIKCSCLLSSSGKMNRETEYTICFLKGLNESYDTVRRQILCMESLPPVAKAFAMAQ